MTDNISALEICNYHISEYFINFFRLYLNLVFQIINYEMPRPESFLSYVHRVGRTGRVGNIGIATTFFAPSVDHDMALALYKVPFYPLF